MWCATDGVSSGVVQCENSTALTDWVKHISNNITQLIGQQVRSACYLLNLCACINQCFPARMLEEDEFYQHLGSLYCHPNLRITFTFAFLACFQRLLLIVADSCVEQRSGFPRPGWSDHHSLAHHITFYLLSFYSMNFLSFSIMTSSLGNSILSTCSDRLALKQIIDMCWVSERTTSHQPWHRWKRKFIAVRGSSFYIFDSPPVSSFHFYCLSASCVVGQITLVVNCFAMADVFDKLEQMHIGC